MTHDPGFILINHKTLLPNLNFVYIGDKYGFVHLLDLNKRSVILKTKVSDSRIININCMSFQTSECVITTISVIARNNPVVYLYRHNQFEQ